MVRAMAKREIVNSSPNGVWQSRRVVIGDGPLTGAEADELFDYLDKQALKNPEAIVRQVIDDIFQEAYAVFVEHGLPVIQGFYRELESGKYELVHETDRPHAQRPANLKGGLIEWPDFPSIQDLTPPAFARDVFHAAYRLLCAAASGQNPWIVAALGLELRGSCHRMRTETQGIADHAARGIANLQGTLRGHAKRMAAKNAALDSIIRHAASYLSANPEKRDAKAVATSIREEVNRAILPIRKLGLVTIQKHVQALRSQGKLPQ